MPKVKQKYYAVAVGRDAPNIYTSWPECSEKVSRYPNALHKSFNTQTEAEEWLASKADRTALFSTLTSTKLIRETRESPVTSDLRSDAPLNPAMDQKNIVNPEPAGSNAPVVLSPEQSKVLARVKEGRNVFFTGSAGTGKSVLLREIIKFKEESYSKVAITASTGIAAVNIGGCTLHSWAGIGLGNELVKQFVGKVRKQPVYKNLRNRWRDVNTLIIDEISMIDGELFDKLEHIARELRNSNAPFGGIQLVLCGDFCQLPPVPGRDDKGRQIFATFAFEAQSWDSCIGAPMILTKVFRQKDQTFADMLNEMRYGRMKESTIQIFKSLSRPVTYTDGIEPAEIFSTRREVKDANDSRLKKLRSQPQTYIAQDWPGLNSAGQRITEERMVTLLDRLVAPPVLTLKVGAQVMLIKNLVQGVLVNGSIGQVVKFVTPREAEASRTEIAKAEPEKGNGLGNSNSQSISREVMQTTWKWPVVHFTNGKEVLIIPTDFTINNGDGEMEARRVQLPLILAWALSVHKSQGQTLERVKVDLRRTFENGQAYVALSRATTLDHLQVLHFQPEKVMADPKVLAWYGQPVDIPSDTNDESDEELKAFDEYHL